jgi:hypothetical protein
MLPLEFAFGTPRKLPKPGRISGRVVVLDIAFAGIGSGGGFDKITLPFIEGLGERNTVATLKILVSCSPPRLSSEPVPR